LSHRAGSFGVPQILIDPNDRGDTSGTISVNIVPEKTRKYGFVPNFALCKPGDLILSHPLSSGFLDRRIVRTQIRAGFDAEHARWTHAAVFLYEDLIVEAVPHDGVITRTLYSDIPDSVLRVRRRPGLRDEERYKIALCAQRMLGSRYNIRAALSIGWRARSGLWDRDWFPSIGPVIICSKVFYDAHVEITRSLLRDCPMTDLVMPAHLSATSDLEDVHISWLKLN
jgi:hypothetical protein